MVILNWMDALRRLFWRFMVRFTGSTFISDRSARLTLLATFHISLAFLLTIVAPLWLLLLGPLLLGVPHVISDVRYLLLKPFESASRASVIAILLPLFAMTCLRIYLVLGGAHFPVWEIGCGLLAVLGGIFWGGRSRKRMLWAFLVVGGLGIASLSYPYYAILTLGHLHNFIAFGLWLWWSRGEGPSWRYGFVTLLFFGCIAILAGGWLEPISAWLGVYSGSATGLYFNDLVRTLAPGMSPTIGFRLVLIFAFAQAVHYFIWLRLVPANHTFFKSRGPTTFRRNINGLKADLGTVGFFLCALAVIGLPLVGFFSPLKTRIFYLTLVLFHGWLEIAILARLLCLGSKTVESKHLS